MKKILSILLSALLVVTMFSGCSDNKTADSSAAQETISISDNDVKPINIHTKKQESYLNSSSSLAFLYASGKEENSKPVSVEFLLSDNKNARGEYVLNISENSDMSDAVSYSSSSSGISVSNFKIDTTYYWTVTENGVTGKVMQFETEGDCPRNMDVDGVTNVRDLGGWETESGARTKQGLIYRCGRLNESSAPSVNIEITDKGIKTMRDELGIKSEIDLRKVDDGETGQITSSPLGTDINYYNCPMEWDGNMFEDNKEQILNVFSILSKPENYPLIFHCNIGTDRTGMISFLANALLGVCEEDLYKDYLFSNLGTIGGTRKKSGITDSGYYKAIMEAEGNTLSEKTYNCLLNFGVPKAQLDSIIEILSEK